ncbi:TPA_asm: hypothetical protein GZX72_14695 [Listeria monocytogenes]|nr:hypothetical protein [Listeria monocytogenes]
MGNKTNLDKFMEIEQMMNEAQSLMSSYLEDLEERYHAMKQYRSNLSSLAHALTRINHRIKNRSGELDDDDDVLLVVNSAIKKIDEHIESLEEESLYTHNSKALEQLQTAKECLTGNLKMNKVSQAWQLLRLNKIEIEEIEVILDLLDAMEEDNEDVIEVISKNINNFQNEYLSNFKVYRISREESDDMYRDIDVIAGDLEDANFYTEAEMLNEVKPYREDTRVDRPNAQPLLDILIPIRSAGLKYFQSNNRKSESYSLNVKFADEISFTRKALLENREYVGTENAFNKLNSAYSELSSYMYERYHQLGGTPENYHGHDDR